MVSRIYFQDTNIYQKATFSLLTSSSLLIILHFIDAIQHLGKLNSVYIPLTLVGFEIVKLFIFGGSPPTPQSQPQVKWHWSIIKTTLLIAISVVCYFILAILYGAKAFTEHEETLMFAVHLTACTTIHCIANMGHKVFNTMLTKPSYGDEIILNSSQIVAVASLFGCWVSAVMIPLDWKRWWQKWPIPSVMGTFLGYICGFLVAIALAYFYNDKKVGQPKKKRCV